MAEQDTLTKPEEEVSWQYKPTDQSKSADQPYPGNSASAPPPASKGSGSSVTWTASEFIEHHHSAGWYMLLILTTVAVASGVYFLTKEYFAAGTIGVVGLIVAIFASRKPQKVAYELSASGLRVGQKMYAFGLFKSYSVVKEGGFSTLNLLPLKRFMPPVSAHFASEDEERIVGTISDYLPYEEHKTDGIDRLSRKLKL